MKCPSCGYEQRAKNGLQCGGCGYQFAFNPKSADTLRVTDGKFLACVRSASQNDTAWFTTNQLYAAYSKRNAKLSWDVVPGVVISVAVIAVGLYWCRTMPFTLLLVPVGALMLIVALRDRIKKTPPSELLNLLRIWKASGKSLERLIESPSMHDPPPKWSEPDIYDYGVERILIVERDILVDLFVKNGVHAEQRMLVIAESGYPNYLLPVARRLLEEQRDLPVFLLHDATPRGVEMKDRLLAGGLLPTGGHPITDLGMFPADFQVLSRTKHYHPADEERTLPVDAMMLPFMALGLASAMDDGVSFAKILESPHETTVGSFG